ncbi:hypothetical protein CPT_Mater34 [Bacillus phage Mater]|uniref:Uncharacterized protein n=1 Tax=Bacillus phage Mater TaxID=1540090 RepID=A0A0A0RRU2_9CAUD|nr:hypothetical protein CPT_Mater34 [Bacillus phage Mater]AIW03191.1 hypothetical protein CPT_Mater34 [Bacillus phage Mater]
MTHLEKDNRFDNLSKQQLEKELNFYTQWYKQTICRNTRHYIVSRISEINEALGRK